MADQTQTGNSGDQGQQQQTGSTGSVDKAFSQADVDRIVQDRLNRDRAKYADYEDLRNKVTEYEKHKEQLTQQELEAKKEYDKLKEGWAQRENEYKTKLNEVTLQVQSERVNNTLNQEILKKNAYPEAAQLLKSMTKYNEDGTITIRGKDANGMDTDLSIEQGVEQFLKDRPYLVRGSGQSGGGTGGNVGQGQGAGPEDLSKALQDAMRGGDRKSINDIKARIRAKHAGGGIVQVL
jgi:hypothetical protein